MSNEMISVPRELLVKLLNAAEWQAADFAQSDSPFRDAINDTVAQTKALLAQPAEEHQEADVPPKDSAGELADALESSDWPGVSIGNKVLISAAIQHLRARYSERHQGEPVGYKYRLKGKNRAWTYSASRPDFAEEEFEILPLYTRPAEQLEPAAVVLPERMSLRSSDGSETYETKAWNACLDEVARLNPPQQ